MHGKWITNSIIDDEKQSGVPFGEQGNTMTKVYVAKRNADRCPSHPGAALDDILPSLATPKAEIARLLGISRQQLYDILAERKPISPTMAAKIGKLLGNGPGLWLRMQASYDAWHAEREVDVSHIPTLEQA
jgi:antitoxin HigA-1